MTLGKCNAGLTSGAFTIGYTGHVTRGSPKFLTMGGPELKFKNPMKH